jgi:hypothetical protein
MRGFWADERIAMGMLRLGSPQERMMRMIERGSARRAGGIVTLTAAAIDVLEERHGPAVREKARVVTTCVDLDRFRLSPLPPSPPVRLLLAGTLNDLYDVPLMLAVVDRLRRHLPIELSALVLGSSDWYPALRTAGANPRSATREEMPGYVANCHIGLSIRRASGGVSLKASMPTKIGEFLAAGRPVIVNQGLGDMDGLLVKHGCGVVIDGDSSEALERAAVDVQRLLADPSTPRRCRGLAEAHFNLATGVTSLVDVYRHAIK